MYPPFLTSTLTSKRTTLINLESFTKEEHLLALERISHHPISLSFMEVILASSTPITEECTKLLDHLSEPSSRLIHRISHPPKEDVSAEVVMACFICIQFPFDSNPIQNKSPACRTLYLVVSVMQLFEATCWLPKTKHKTILEQYFQR